MAEVERITGQLRRAFEGDAWHGPALKHLLAGITPDQAAARPIPAAHSIWELVLHIGAWEHAALRRLQGDFRPVPDEEDFPPVPEPGTATWQQALTEFEERHAALCRAIAAFDDQRLDETVGDTPTTYYSLLHGVVQHDLYHGGQIALLRKAMGL